MTAKTGKSRRVAKKPATPAKSRPAWPADAVERRAVADLVPYARNARTHSGEQVAQLAAAIREFGWTIPVLVDEQSNIIAGHGRVLAAQSLGLTDIPVMVARGWTEEQRRLYVIFDNKSALNAGWDEDILRLEMLDLREGGVDLGLSGFGTIELASLFKTAKGATDPDDVPEPPADPVSVLGDVWVLGKHRLMCGDCTDAAVVEALLAGAKPHLMVTDPPYGVNYDPKWRAAAGVNKSTKKLGVVENDDRADWREAWALFFGDVAYVWHAGLFADVVADSLVATGFALRSQIVWCKDRFALSRGDYHWQHEPCWYAVRAGKKGHWAGDRSQSTRWDIKAREDGGVGHGTQKPVECMKRPIENNSQAGDAVYEPFSGSGTTIIAAEMTGRRCHAIELNPVYIDVAVTRWQAFVGQEAHLEETGETFSQVQARRRPPQEKAAA
jgi:DNA modification methylase